MANRQTATALAPASIGNVAVGFDMLGLAIAGAGDRVTARRADAPDVRIVAVRDPQGDVHRDLPTDSQSNTASVAANALWQAAGEEGGLELEVAKGVPLKSGMGSSAASAVAAVVAVNALLQRPLDTPELLPFALDGETVASGAAHADNVAPSLLGGLVLTPPALAPRCIEVPVPGGLSSVLIHPDLFVSTAEARGRLATTVSREDWLAQQGLLAGFLLGLQHDDHDLLGACLKDLIIEPQRAAAVPGFSAIKDAALDAGALGASLSGSGPSLFALCAVAAAQDVAAAMTAACRAAGHDCESWISPLAAPGARLVEQNGA